MKLRFTAFAAAFLLTTSLTHAADNKAGNLHVEKAVARATVPGQPTGAAYLTIENKGTTADRLVAASSPAARAIELHTMSMSGNMMKMREVPNIELKPSARMEMKPGDGFHLMLMGLTNPLKAGDSFPLTLTFEKAGKTEVTVQVQDLNAGAKAAGHHGH